MMQNDPRTNEPTNHDRCDGCGSSVVRMWTVNRYIIHSRIWPLVSRIWPLVHCSVHSVIYEHAHSHHITYFFTAYPACDHSWINLATRELIMDTWYIVFDKGCPLSWFDLLLSDSLDYCSDGTVHSYSSSVLLHRLVRRYWSTLVHAYLETWTWYK